MTLISRDLLMERFYQTPVPIPAQVRMAVAVRR